MTNKVKLSEVGTVIEFANHDGSPYRVRVPAGDYLIVDIGVLAGSPAERYRPATLAATRRRLFEFKHSRANGSKYWTSAVGTDYYFVIPKEKIELVLEPGYSYIPVEINGHPVTLNVSGGTTGDGGWEDFFSSIAGTIVTRKKADVQVLADAAWGPDELKKRGITVAIPEPSEYELNAIAEHDTRKRVKSSLVPGSVFYLDGWSFNGVTGPFSVHSVKGRTVIGSCEGRLFRTCDSHIDWLKTAASLEKTVA
jgi:hypothetical protein